MKCMSIYYFEDNFILYVFGSLESIELSKYLDRHGFLYKTENIFGDIEVILNG